MINRTMLGYMALIAEHKVGAIGALTKPTLEGAKARGQRLGWPNPNR